MLMTRSTGGTDTTLTGTGCVWSGAEAAGTGPLPATAPRTTAEADRVVAVVGVTVVTVVTVVGMTVVAGSPTSPGGQSSGSR